MLVFTLEQKGARRWVAKLGGKQVGEAKSKFLLQEFIHHTYKGQDYIMNSSSDFVYGLIYLGNLHDLYSHTI